MTLGSPGWSHNHLPFICRCQEFITWIYNIQLIQYQILWYISFIKSGKSLWAHNNSDSQVNLNDKRTPINYKLNTTDELVCPFICCILSEIGLFKVSTRPYAPTIHAILTTWNNDDHYQVTKVPPRPCQFPFKLFFFSKKGRIDI